MNEAQQSAFKGREILIFLLMKSPAVVAGPPGVTSATQLQLESEGGILFSERVKVIYEFKSSVAVKVNQSLSHG